MSNIPVLSEDPEVIVESILRNSEDSPYVIKRVKVTKPLALSLLTYTNFNNRKLNVNVVNSFTELMNKGMWDENSLATIVISNDPRQLLDGQHRLNAFLRSNRDYLYMLFVIGAPASVAAYIDQEQRRTARDIIIMTRGNTSLHSRADRTAHALEEIYAALYHRDYETYAAPKAGRPFNFNLPKGWPIFEGRGANKDFQMDIMCDFDLMSEVLRITNRVTSANKMYSHDTRKLNKILYTKFPVAAMTMALNDYIINTGISEEEGLAKFSQFIDDFQNMGSLPNGEIKSHLVTMGYYFTQPTLERNETAGSNPGPFVFFVYNGLYRYLTNDNLFDSTLDGRLHRPYFRPIPNMRSSSPTMLYLKELDNNRLSLGKRKIESTDQKMIPSERRDMRVKAEFKIGRDGRPKVRSTTVIRSESA